MKKTHHCCELRKTDVGNKATLVGWVDTIRDHGGVNFIDLRDREGITQIVFDPENTSYKDTLSKLKPESVIEVSGTVLARDAQNINSGMATGEIELSVESILIHNISKTPPFPLEDDKAERVNEDLRLQYRYLDLRRPAMYKIMKTRHDAVYSARQYLNDSGFLEIETPSLFKSTPEGAREFLVPSRINPGHFYALSQSPQQMKQMLMVAGVERYYQIARCFRDEDLRADRQPEFTQIDIELSFIDREDMYTLIEGMLKKIWKDVLDIDLQTPFIRMPYKEAMNRFGVDKPDTRYGLEIQDLSDLFKDSQFKVFASTVQSGGVVKAINAKGLADATQGEMKLLEDGAKSLGAKGLAFIRCLSDGWKSPILKFFSEEEINALKERLDIEEGDMIFFAAAEWERACNILGRVRHDSAQLLVKKERLVIPHDQYNFLWVVDFPLMILDEEEGRYVAAHHPFTAPVVEDIDMLDTDPQNVRAQAYDCVLNGLEVAGGSIRIHQPELQRKVFENVLKIPEDVVRTRFGYFLKAFDYGAPPHGGIAFGVERLIMILTNRNSIRDVVAFPKTQKGQCLMSSSPSAVTEKQLKDIHIEIADSVDMEK